MPAPIVIEYEGIPRNSNRVIPLNGCEWGGRRPPPANVSQCFACFQGRSRSDARLREAAGFHSPGAMILPLCLRPIRLRGMIRFMAICHAGCNPAFPQIGRIVRAVRPSFWLFGRSTRGLWATVRV